MVNGPITGIDKQRAISFRRVRVERVGKLWRDGKLPKSLRAAVLSTLEPWAGKDAECTRLLEAIEKE